VPGDPSTSTGGYIYDAQILAGLAELGWRTRVHSLDESFPRPTPAALREARERLAALPGDGVVVIDGLALAGLERVLESEAKRLAIVALVHHPLALETGIAAGDARLLETAERNALAFARRVIVTSQWTARALGAYGVPIERLRVVEPGVDRRVARRPRAARAEARPHTSAARVDVERPSRDRRRTGMCAAEPQGRSSGVSRGRHARVRRRPER